MSNKESNFEPTHSFLIEDVVRLGCIEKAIIVKEIRQMSVYKIRMGKEPWVFYSSSALEEKFPYMNSRSIRRWMVELEESGELVSIIKNKMRYDKTKSYTLKTLIGQNGRSIDQNGQTIPPLSPSLSKYNFSDEKFTSSKDSVKQRTVTNTNFSSITAPVESLEEVRVNIDDEGNERPQRVKKVSQGKNQVAGAYKDLCKKYLGEVPVINVKSLSAIKYAREKFKLSDKDIIGVLEDWVWRTNIGPDEKLNINMALSFKNITIYKNAYNL